LKGTDWLAAISNCNAGPAGLGRYIADLGRWAELMPTGSLSHLTLTLACLPFEIVRFLRIY
jgi:hypothetical protein